MPKVSVIIATHNRPHLLPRAIESAFKAGTDVEVVVVNDASDDETAEVCQEIEGIKYIHVERNQKTAGARNLGILASTAPYITFLDDDDWRLPDSLDWQVAMLDENPEYGLVYGKFFLADQNGEILSKRSIPAKLPQGDVFYQLFEENLIGCLTAVFRRECIYKVGMLDVNYSGIDDWDLWVRIAELYPFLAIEKTVAVWRKAEAGSGQGSSDTEKLFQLGVKACKKKWSKLPRALERIEILKERDIFQGKSWLQSRVEQMENHIQHLDRGKEWFEQQYNNWKLIAEEQEEYINQLTSGKEWFEQQYNNWKLIAEEQEEYINQLTSGKEWFEQQYNNWKLIAEEREEYIRQISE